MEIPGYMIYRLDRDKKLGGGVCAFVKEGYKTERLNELSSISESGLHQMWLKIQIGNRKSFIVCTVYRPPDAALNCFEDDFGETVISALSLNKDIYILGDLNCNVLDAGDQGGRTFSNFCTAYNLTQVINEPTRITQSSKFLIDIILVSNKNVVEESKVLPVSISDHDLVYVTLNVKKTRPKPIYITTLSFKHYNRDAFNRDISMAPWSVIDNFDDVENKLNAFHLLFNPILDNHAPIKRTKIRGRSNPLCN